jgi:hypothetical protein
MFAGLWLFSFGILDYGCETGASDSRSCIIVRGTALWKQSAEADRYNYTYCNERQRT